MGDAQTQGLRIRSRIRRERRRGHGGFGVHFKGQHAARADEAVQRRSSLIHKTRGQLRACERQSHP